MNSKGPAAQVTAGVKLQSRGISYSILITALLACHHAREDRPDSLHPVRYRGPALPTVSPPGSTAGMVVGAVYDCSGNPLASVLMNAGRHGANAENAADSLVQVVDSTFATRFLNPGKWELTFRLIGYSARSIEVAIAPATIDTVMVQLNESSTAIGDCVCANGDFGS
jgi:hypothetical protein